MNAPAWMGSVSLGTLAVSLFVVLTVGGLVWALLRPIVRSARSTDRTLQELRRDWFGQEGRPGFPAVPGVPQRLYDVEQVLIELRPVVDRIDREMKPNGGSSVRDQVAALTSTVDKIQMEVGALTRAMDSVRTLRALAANVEQSDSDDSRRAG